MKKISINDTITLAATLLSLLALVVSISSCRTSEKALELSTQQYKDDRHLILQGTMSDANDSMTLKSINDSSSLIEGRAIFPSSISDSEWKIRSEDKILRLALVKFSVKEIIKKNHPPERGLIKFGDSKEIPVVIESYYTSHGRRYRDLSLYIIEVSFTIKDDLNSDPEIEFNGLKFLSRYDSETQLNRNLIDIFNHK